VIKVETLKWLLQIPLAINILDLNLGKFFQIVNKNNSGKKEILGDSCRGLKIMVFIIVFVSGA
jgi:hypothetical protein